MLRKGIVLGLCSLLLGGIVLAERKTVKLRNGGEITGEVTKTKDGYQVKQDSGVTSFVKADQVVAIVDYVSPDEEYERRKAEVKVDPENPHRAHFELGNWAYRKGYYEIAEKELREALRLKGDYELAQLVLKRVERKLRKPPVGAENGNGPKENGGETPADELMDKIDINRIRLVELRADDRVRILFQGGIIAKFVKANRGVGIFAERGGERRFMRYSNMEKAQYILDSVDRENYAVKDKIVVRGDPGFMVDFRRLVWPVVSQNCAGRECHGGDKILGGVKFFRAGASRERTDYTNFYILDSYEKDSLNMIDRSTPENSLLLHYGLPRALAEFRHPKPIPPIFRDRSDRSFLQIDEWIRTTLKHPHPDYGVRYKPAGRGELVPGPLVPPAQVPEE